MKKTLEAIGKEDNFMFIKIDNKLLEGKETGVSNESLYLYSILTAFSSNYVSKIAGTSFKRLNEFEVKDAFNKTKKRNLEVVKKSFKELAKKGYIELKYDDNLDNIKDEYIITKRFESKASAPFFQTSYENWAKILEVSKRTAIRYIKQADEKGLINIEIGDYIEDNKQDVNKYTTNIVAKVYDEVDENELEEEAAEDETGDTTESVESIVELEDEAEYNSSDKKECEQESYTDSELEQINTLKELGYDDDEIKGMMGKNNSKAKKETNKKVTKLAFSVDGKSNVISATF